MLKSWTVGFMNMPKQSFPRDVMGASRAREEDVAYCHRLEYTLECEGNEAKEEGIYQRMWEGGKGN